MLVIKRKSVSRSSVKLSLTTLGCALFLSQAALAAPTNADELIYTQPDGTVIFLTEKSLNSSSWLEDNEGYSVVKTDQQYVYAKQGSGGSLEPTRFIVGQHNPELWGFAKHIAPEPKK